MKTEPAQAMPTGQVDLAKIRAKMPQFGQRSDAGAAPSFAQAMGEGKREAVVEAVRASMGLPRNTEGLAAARIAPGSSVTAAQAALVVPDQPAAERPDLTGGPLPPKAPHPDHVDGEQVPGPRTGGPSQRQAHDPSLVEEYHGPVVRTGGPDAPVPSVVDEDHGPADLTGGPFFAPPPDRPGSLEAYAVQSDLRHTIASLRSDRLPPAISLGRDD